MENEMLAQLLGSMGWQEWSLLIVSSLPPFFILYSKRVSGGKKLLWFLLTSVLSWFAYVPFLLLTRKTDASSDQSPEKAE